MAGRKGPDRSKADRKVREEYHVGTVLSLRPSSYDECACFDAYRGRSPGKSHQNRTVRAVIKNKPAPLLEDACFWRGRWHVSRPLSESGQGLFLCFLDSLAMRFRGLLMVALRSQGNWRWEGPLGTPLGLVHWKRASSPVEAGTLRFLPHLQLR